MRQLRMGLGEGEGIIKMKKVGKKKKLHLIDDKDARTV